MKSIARILGVAVALFSLHCACAFATEMDADALAFDSDYIPLIFNDDPDEVIDKAPRYSVGRSYSAPRMTAPRMNFRPSAPPAYGAHAPRIRTAPRMTSTSLPTYSRPTRLPQGTPRAPHPQRAPRMTDEQRARYFGTGSTSSIRPGEAPAPPPGFVRPRMTDEQRARYFGTTPGSQGTSAQSSTTQRPSALPQRESNSTTRVYTPSARPQTGDRTQSSVRPDLASTNVIGGGDSNWQRTGTMTPVSGGQTPAGLMPPTPNPVGTLPGSRPAQGNTAAMPAVSRNLADHRLVHPDPFPGMPTEPQMLDNANPLSSQFTRSQPAPGFTPAPTRIPDFIVGPGFDPWARNQIRPVSRPPAAEAMKPMRGLDASSSDQVGLKPVHGELIGGGVSTSPGVIPGGK